MCGTLNYSDISYLLWLTHKEVVCFGFCTTRPTIGWAVLNRQQDKVATVQILKRTDLKENQANKAMLPKLLHGFTQRKRPQHVLAGMSTKCSWGTRGPSYTHTDTAAHFQTKSSSPACVTRMKVVCGSISVCVTIVNNQLCQTVPWCSEQTPEQDGTCSNKQQSVSV